MERWRIYCSIFTQKTSKTDKAIKERENSRKMLKAKMVHPILYELISCQFLAEQIKTEPCVCTLRITRLPAWALGTEGPDDYKRDK